MLASHLNAIEKVLIAQSQVAANAGHPNLRGGPREWFIREFLETHLPTTLEIGQGEIIDVKSPPRPSPATYRPQVDIVIYRRDVPKITFSRTDTAFLVEGVMATIESKSELRKEGGGLKEVCENSKNLKSLNRPRPLHGFITGYVPDHLVSYVVAYDGPGKMETIIGWLNDFTRDLDMQPREMVDLIVVLGKGVVCRKDGYPGQIFPESPSEHHWAYLQQADNNLFAFFAHMLTWVGASSLPVNITEYAAKKIFGWHILSTDR